MLHCAGFQFLKTKLVCAGFVFLKAKLTKKVNNNKPKTHDFIPENRHKTISTNMDHSTILAQAPQT